jgi:outer membrane protein insertion porin family
MMFRRPRRLATALLFLSCAWAAGQAPQPAPQQAPQQKPPEQKPPQKSPFEEVAPTTQEPKPVQQPGMPAKPQLEQVKPEEQPPKPAAPQNIIESIEFRGARRFPQDRLKALIVTKTGDPYDEEILRRDFMAIWNTGKFDDIRLETEPGKTGLILRYILTERPVIRTIKYAGNKSISDSEILDRFKERKVGLSVESQYDPAKIQRAAVVLKEYLAERGRQFAKVEPQIRRVPPSSLEVIFMVDEGPKIKVGNITIQGNEAFSQRDVVRAMKNLHPIGVPHSILLENLFAKTYDEAKLEEDRERIVHEFYQSHGYFMAKTLDPTVTMRDVGGGKFRFPILHTNHPGKVEDIIVPVEEGRQYHLNKINFVGVKLFRTPETLMRPLFGMAEGDVFSTAKLRKGMENMRNLYGEFGYINFVPEPEPVPVPNTNKMDLTITVDEGKQYFVRRIDFSGNTTTRDRVIRRELLIDEGQLFNTRMWELSILRLNQLGYFEPLKKDESAEIKQDNRTNTVDITLKVKERGKNSVGLTGGVSGIAGSFIGFNYSTNNFLGLGETLSLNSQLGTRLRQATFGFTEPYFLDKPLQVGFTVSISRFNYDQAREASILSGQNLISYFQALGTNNLLNYVSTGYGFTTFISHPLKRSFARVGITYGFNVQNIKTLTTAATTYFDYINFSGIGGPTALTGIRTSQITLSYSYNSVNHPITPTNGKSLFISTAFASSLLGGNVNTITPAVDFKYFHPAMHAKAAHPHVIGFHAAASMITGYGGRLVPPFSRYYMGGENDIRGFEIWGISPIAFIPSTAAVNVYNPDGSQRMQKTITNGVESFTPVTMNVPTYQMVFPGGDLQTYGNFEYRIPIVGPVTLAYFVDGGVDKVIRDGQLSLTASRIETLNNEFPEAGFNGKALIYPGTQKPRMSTGLEIQVLMPVVNAPFRVYYAYNPLCVREYIDPPIVADRSYFPNQETFQQAVTALGQQAPFFEKRGTFRFTIGRTF